MRHENQQIGNLLLSVERYSFKDLNLCYNPNPNISKKENILSFMNRLPKTDLANVLKVGAVIQLKELKEFGGVNALIIVGSRRTGNIILLIDQRVFDNELAMYNRYPMYIDRIRSVTFSTFHNQSTQGKLGEIYRRYSEAVRSCIDDERFEDLCDISYVSMIHDFALTGKIPDLSNVIG